MIEYKDIVERIDNTEESPHETTGYLQSLLNEGGDIKLEGNGEIVINDTLIVYSDTNLHISPGLTIKRADSTNKPMFKCSMFYDAGVTVTISWTSGELATVNWTGHGQSANDYIWLFGANQSPYRGVFFIRSITDANSFVIQLERTPTAAATGTIKAVVPNKNITFDIQGMLDGNSANQSISVGTDRHLSILGGFNLNVINYRFTNSVKYGLCIAAFNDLTVGSVYTPYTGSDCMKLYGPGHHAKIDDVFATYCGDDCLSLTAKEPAAFSIYDFSNGDLIDIEIGNVRCDNTAAGTFKIYPTDVAFIDDIRINKIKSSGQSGIVETSGLTSCIVGSVRFGSILANEHSSGSIVPIRLDMNGTIDYVSFDKISGYQGAAGLGFIEVTANTVINKFLATSPSFLTGAAASYFVLVGGTVRHLEVTKGRFTSLGTFNARCMQITGTVTKLIMDSNYFASLDNIVNVTSAATTGIEIVFKFNHINNCFGALALQQNAKVTLMANSGNVSTNGLVRGNQASKQIDITSLGGNLVTASGSMFIKAVGSEIFSMNGIDIPIDLAFVTRAVGGVMAKASVNAGTILAGNVAVNDMTNAANSWKQVSNTTLVF